MKLVVFFLCLLSLDGVAQQLRVEFQPSNQPVAAALPYNTMLKTYLTYINQTLKFPKDIPVVFCDCGQENAFYDPSSQSIKICYEFIQSGFKRTQKRFGGTDENIIGGIATTVLGHELGHGLIDWYRIPYTGKQENAVDQFSAVMQMKGPSSIYIGAIYGAFNWFAMSRDWHKRVDRLFDPTLGYGDVHAPSAERYYDILSILNGSEPGQFIRLGYAGTEPWQLPTSRAKGAHREYSDAIHTWETLLKDIYKDSNVSNSQGTIASTTRQISSNAVAESSPVAYITFASEYWSLPNKTIRLNSTYPHGTIKLMVKITPDGKVKSYKELPSDASLQFRQAIEAALTTIQFQALKTIDGQGTIELIAFRY